MIFIYIFIYIPAAFLIFVVLKGIFSKEPPPTDFTRRKRRRRSSGPRYTGLPWMGGKKIKD